MFEKKSEVVTMTEKEIRRRLFQSCSDFCRQGYAKYPLLEKGIPFKVYPLNVYELRQGAIKKE